MKTSSRLQEVTQELSMADDSMSVFTFSDQKTMWNIYENDIHHSDGCQSLVLCWVAISLNTDKIPDRFIALNRSYLPGMVNPFWHSVGHVCHWHVTTQNFTISVRYLSVTRILVYIFGEILVWCLICSSVYVDFFVSFGDHRKFDQNDGLALEFSQLEWLLIFVVLLIVFS